MKRILAILLAALLLCCVFVACDEEEEQPERPSTSTTTEETTTEAPTSEEPTTEEVTTDDGQPSLTDVYVDVWEENTQTPQAINEKHKGVGIRVTIPEGGYLYEASVSAPSYSDNLGSLTMKVYAWNTDYDTTVAAEPLFAEQFVDFADNSDLLCEFDPEQIPGGTYLILVCDGVDESGSGVGVWMDNVIKDDDLKAEVEKYDIQSWINGKQNKKKIGKFSLVITELEE